MVFTIMVIDRPTNRKRYIKSFFLMIFIVNYSNISEPFSYMISIIFLYVPLKVLFCFLIFFKGALDKKNEILHTT